MGVAVLVLLIIGMLLLHRRRKRDRARLLPESEPKPLMDTKSELPNNKMNSVKARDGVAELPGQNVHEISGVPDASEVAADREPREVAADRQFHSRPHGLP